MTFFDDYIENSSRDKGSLLKYLLERLKPNSWPITIADLPLETTLVGGSIRDGFLDRLGEKPDLDFIVREKAIQLVENLARKVKGTSVVLDQKRDIARLVANGWTLDFARQVGKSLEDDLTRRDFRINAIGLKLNSEYKLYDPLGGIKDLRDKTIVAISEKNFIEDPLRMLRGFRLMSELNFSLDEKTNNYFVANAQRLKNVARERIKVEILKIVSSKYGDDVIPLLKESRLLGNWQSNELSSNENLMSKDLRNFDTNEISIAIPLFRTVSLLSDKGLSELNFSKNKFNRIRALRLWQKNYDGLSFKTLSEDSRLQLHIDLEHDLPALILILPSEDQKAWLRRWRDPSDALFHPRCPIDGFTLQKIIGLSPGPMLGELMRHLSKEKAFGRLSNNKEAFDVARNWTQHNQPFL